MIVRASIAALALLGAAVPAFAQPAATSAGQCTTSLIGTPLTLPKFSEAAQKRLDQDIEIARADGEACAEAVGDGELRRGELFFQKHADRMSIPGIERLDAALDPGHAPLLAVPTREAVEEAAAAEAKE